MEKTMLIPISPFTHPNMNWYCHLIHFKVVISYASKEHNWHCNPYIISQFVWLGVGADLFKRKVLLIDGGWFVLREKRLLTSG
jgi:hypothetical protein